MLGYCTRAMDKKRDAGKNAKERKRKGILSPQNLRYKRGKHKVLNYLLYMVGAGPGPANQNQPAWGPCMVYDATLFDGTEGVMTEEVAGSVWSMDSTNRTPRRTLELAGRIGKRPM